MDFLDNPHSKHISLILDSYKTSIDNGLEEKEVTKRFFQFGKNSLRKRKKTSLINQVFSQFKDPIIIILLVACLLTLFLRHFDNAIAIIVVILINTCLGIFQQWKAEKSIEGLSIYLAQTAIVIRDGIKKIIPAQDLVIGDLIFLEAGQKVPADARLAQTTNFTVDQSILTGETLSVEKEANEIYPEDCLTPHQNNMVFSGTTITSGRALAIVTSTGEQTQIGQMSLEIEQIDETPSPLQIRMKKFSSKLTIVILFFIFFIFILGFLRGVELLNIFLMSLSLIVTAIPEGLPLAITLCLSSGIRHMANRKAIVKRLSAVETLGSCNVICSDKTGTITTHEMFAESIYVGSTVLKVTGNGYDPKGEILGKAVLNKLSMVCAYTHECEIKKVNNKYICIGDPTEGALVTLARKIGNIPEIHGISFDVPFESERKWMAVTVKKGDSHYIFIKGALSSILKKSNQMLNENENICSIDFDKINAQEKEYAKDGYRIIALAFKEVTNSVTAEDIDSCNTFTYIGMVALSDPPRKEVYTAVKCCLDLGVKIKMITGDSPLTAQSIANKIKIKKEPVSVINGEDLDKLDSDSKINLIKNTDVFARVMPKHKVMIVSALQEDGMIVAMTGDGVNDAASLKKADMGVAMGSGSDIAKEAASLIILDDNFSTIVEALKQGRIIFENLKKMIFYLITTAISGVGVLLCTTVLGWAMPLLPLQLLWINLVTDGSSTIPLALEGGRIEDLSKKPNKKNSPIVDKKSFLRMMLIGFYMSLGTVSIFYYQYYFLGCSLEKSQTMAFCTLALFQIWNVQCSRSLKFPIIFSLKKFKKNRITFFSNKFLLTLMILAGVLQVVVVENKFFQKILNTQSLSLLEWGMIVSLTSSIFLFSDICKSLVKQEN